MRSRYLAGSPPGLALTYLAVFALALIGLLAAVTDDHTPVVVGSGAVIVLLSVAAYVYLRRNNATLTRQLENEYAYRHALLRAAEELGQALAIVADDRFVDVNEAACGLLGYRRSQFLTFADYSRVIAPEGREEKIETIRAAIAAGQTSHLPLIVVRGDGQHITIDLSAAPFTVDGRERLLLLARPLPSPAEAPAREEALTVPPRAQAATPATAGEPEPALTRALSPREIQVLELVARGYSNQDIAEALNISLKTVEVHTVNIRKKLPIRNRVQMVRYALQHGIVRLNEDSDSSRRRRG